ncbi:uncharacterized protein LOC113980069, partial [Neopelma chrysocephalum]|uniref:uncharacterized protein LOC113980069 n=1 Tax=Neopelma chrysocephalum TaxID=114329 RepID=UPI000FCCE496
MAGRHLSLLRPFRMKKRKKKKKEGPEAAPAQQPEKMEQLHPLQEDPGRDRTQEQDRGRGRFRRSDQAFLKFVGIQRRKTRTSPTEVMAQPDTRLTKLMAKSDVGTAPTDRTTKSDPVLNDHTRNSDTTPIDQRMEFDTSLTDDTTDTYSPSVDRMAVSDMTDDLTNSDTALPDLTAEAEAATTEGITDTDPTPSDRMIDSPNWDFFEENGVSSSKQVPSRPDCGMAERSLSLCGRKKEGPGAAPVQQPKEVQQSQPLQEDPGRDRTEEQDRARGCWRFIGQMFRDFRGTAKADVSIRPTERMANTDSTPTQSLADAPGLDSSEERVVSAKVQAFMKNMHQRLTANTFPENRLFMDILRLTDTYPADVALTLLRCSPSCDRAAAIMWRTIALSETTVVRVLPTLLSVMEDWPQHSVSTSNEDNKDIFALAATRVVWEILQMIQCPEPLMEHSPRLLVDLLFQVFISTEQMPEEVDTFWRRCWEEHRLARNPNRFAVLTMKTLLCRLQFENIVMAMERKHGWDTLLNSDTHHYA